MPVSLLVTINMCFLRMVMVWSVETTCLYSWNCLLDSLKHQSIQYFIIYVLYFHSLYPRVPQQLSLHISTFSLRLNLWLDYRS